MGDIKVEYNDSRLMQLIEDLDSKARRRALRSSFRKAGNQLRREVIGNLRSSGLKTDKYVERGVRTIPVEKRLALWVTIGPRRRRGKSATSRSAEEKRNLRKSVVPFWAEGGTEQRHRNVKGRSTTASTGRLKPYRFMEKTEGNTEQLYQTLTKSIIDNIEKATIKAGGKLI